MTQFSVGRHQSWTVLTPESTLQTIIPYVQRQPTAAICDSVNGPSRQLIVRIPLKQDIYEEIDRRSHRRCGREMREIIDRATQN